MATKKNRIQLVSWDPVAIWSYNVVTNECAICRNKLTQKCATCMESKTVLNEVCNTSKGKCGHAFHYHCIKSSLNTGNDACPIDNVVWNFELENINNTGNKKIQIRH